MKKIITGLLIITILCTTLCSCSNTKTSPAEDFVYEFENGNTIITGYTGSELDIILPEEIDNRPVTSIANKAFKGYDLNSIVVSKNVTDIQEEAFQDCTNLSSVTLPDGIQNIGLNAFNNCSNLVYINLPDSIVNLDYGTFSSCTELKEITLPNNITTINSNTFSECSSLSSVKFPEKLEIIGNNAFYKCISLANISLPNTIKVIDKCAFSECSQLSDVGSLDTATVKIEENAFLNTLVQDNFVFSIDSNGVLIAYSGKDSTITIPENVTEIGKSVFSCNDYICSVKLSSNTKKIGAQAFMSCRNLSEVILPDELISIEYDAFSGCKNLKCLHIPESVKNIADYSIGIDLLYNAYEDFVIYGKQGSAAEQYAKKFNLKFVNE